MNDSTHEKNYPPYKMLNAERKKEMMECSDTIQIILLIIVGFFNMLLILSSFQLFGFWTSTVCHFGIPLLRNLIL
jgi:hypothetical protein